MEGTFSQPNLWKYYMIAKITLNTAKKILAKSFTQFCGSVLLNTWIYDNTKGNTKRLFCLRMEYFYHYALPVHFQWSMYMTLKYYIYNLWNLMIGIVYSISQKLNIFEKNPFCHRKLKLDPTLALMISYMNMQGLCSISCYLHTWCPILNEWQHYQLKKSTIHSTALTDNKPQSCYNFLPPQCCMVFLEYNFQMVDRIRYFTATYFWDTGSYHLKETSISLQFFLVFRSFSWYKESLKI